MIYLKTHELYCILYFVFYIVYCIYIIFDSVFSLKHEMKSMPIIQFMKNKYFSEFYQMSKLRLQLV